MRPVRNRSYLRMLTPRFKKVRVAMADCKLATNHQLLKSCLHALKQLADGAAQVVLADRFGKNIAYGNNGKVRRTAL